MPIFITCTVMSQGVVRSIGPTKVHEKSRGILVISHTIHRIYTNNNLIVKNRITFQAFNRDEIFLFYVIMNWTC